jgi:hypothetical protein
MTTYANGDRFVGMWKDNLRTDGVLTYANGDTHRGKFNILTERTRQYPMPLGEYASKSMLHPSPPNGYGIYTTKKKIMAGLWKNDRAQGYFIITNPDGTKRSHFFRNNKCIDEGVPLLPRYEEGCAICLDDFTPEMGQVVATCCNHYFHEKCIRPAIQRNPDCPLCRTVVESSKLKSIASCVRYP